MSCRWLIALIFLSGSFLPRRSGAEEAPKHLHEAEVLVHHLSLNDTEYRHGEPSVEWKGNGQATNYASHADCSGFVDSLFTHTYGYTKEDYKNWFGKNRPTAAAYHDTIVAEKGFARIERVQDLHPGDLIAVKYLKRKDNTGHVMLADGKPQRMEAKHPIVAGTEQWEVKIIDSSESGHGTTDTRHHKGENGKDHTGLGEGVLRIYSHANGQVAGWAWSTLKVSEFKDPQDEQLVIGRLKVGYKP